MLVICFELKQPQVCFLFDSVFYRTSAIWPTAKDVTYNTCFLFKAGRFIASCILIKFVFYGISLCPVKDQYHLARIIQICISSQRFISSALHINCHQI